MKKVEDRSDRATPTSTNISKKRYEPPAVIEEEVFERLTMACGRLMPSCGPNSQNS
jgi:hypothetical protein